MSPAQGRQDFNRLGLIMGSRVVRFLPMSQIFYADLLNFQRFILFRAKKTLWSLKCPNVLCAVGTSRRIAPESSTTAWGCRGRRRKVGWSEASRRRLPDQRASFLEGDCWTWKKSRVLLNKVYPTQIFSLRKFIVTDLLWPCHKLCKRLAI